MRYTLNEVAAALGGKPDRDGDAVIEGISTDTRAIRPGEVFFALIGDTHDGHNYLQGLKDCAAAVVSRPVEGLAFPVIRVPDTLKALGDFAAFHRSRCPALTIGITGSVGKTSTKEMTASLLEELGPCVKTHANFNNEIGLPLTVLQAGEDTRTLVTEMGMRGPGQIAYLCRIARPDIGIITNIGLSHIELLKTQDNIASAKAELLEALAPSGAAFVNWDGRYHKRLRNACKGRFFTFGANSDADIYPVDPRLSGEGIRFSAVTPFGVLTELFIPTLAEHYMINALAAVGCALYCGVSEDYIRGKLAEYRNIDKRFNVITSPSGLTVIDDTYNANPASMDGAVRTLARLPGRTRTAILGDMLELGDYAEELHYELGRTVARLQIDRLCCVGELSGHVAEGAAAAGMDPARISRFESSAAMSESIRDGDFRSGDCVLVKGSRSMKMERISLLLINM